MIADDLQRELLSLGIGEIPRVLGVLYRAGRKLGSRIELAKALIAYRDLLDSSHSQIQILGMETPVSLNDIYIEARATRQFASREAHSAEDLEKQARDKVEKTQLVSISEAACKKIEKELLQQEISQKQAPIYEETSTPIQEYNASIHTIDEELSSDLHVGTETGAPLPENKRGAQKFLSNFKIAKLKKERKGLNESRDELVGRQQASLAKIRAQIVERGLTDGQQEELELRLPRAIETMIRKEVENQLGSSILREIKAKEEPASKSEPAWKVVERKRRTLVLGKPGAGKTTLLKHLVLRHLCERAAKPGLPVYAQLRQLADGKRKSVREIIARDLKECGFPEPLMYVDRLLKGSDPCIFLFDGLDELPKDIQRKVVDEITLIARRSSHHQFVVSCRTASYAGTLEGFTEVEIVDFTPKQVRLFAEKWFRSTPSLAVSFVQQLRCQPGLQELTSTPLLLAILCIAYRRKRHFHDQIALLYKDCIDALLLDWDSTRQVSRESFVEGLDCESKKQLLSKVACDLFCEGKHFASREELIRHFNVCSENLPIVQGAGADILKEFVEHHGLLVERSRRIFSFSHLTIQEFLTAYHIWSNQSAALYSRVCNELWNDPSWQEVVYFVGGLESDASTLLVCLRNLMKQKLLTHQGSANFLSFSPPSGVQVVLQSMEDSSLKDGWEAWFRARMLEAEYELMIPRHEGDRLRRLVPVSDQVARIAELFTEGEPRGISSHALHEILQGFYIEYRTYALRAKLDSHKEAPTETTFMNTYLNVLSIVLRILSSRPRVQPELVPALLQDVYRSNTDSWPLPSATNANRIGI